MSAGLRRHWQTGRTIGGGGGGPGPEYLVPTFQTRTAGTATGGNAFSTGQINVNMPSGLASGNLILVTLGVQRPTSAPNPSLTGFTLLLSSFLASGTSGGLLCIFGKISAGNESLVVFNNGTNGASSMSYIAERWTNVASLPATSTAYSAVNGSGTFTLTAPEVTTTIPNSLVYSAIGGRGPSGGDVVPSWGGGASELYTTPSGGSLSFVQNAMQLLATPGPTQHTATITNNQGAPTSNIGSIIIVPQAA